jgi:hypothetical protein
MEKTMPTSITEKTSRTLKLLLNVHHSLILPVMEAHGYAKEDDDEGWELLRAISYAKNRIAKPPAPNTTTIHRIDTWENVWFPIAQATLTRRFPAVAAKFFHNLSQMSGADVVVSVQLFLDRYDDLTKEESGYGPEGAQAKEMLAARGLTPAVLDEARALLLALRDPRPALSPESLEQAKIDAQKAEDALWGWYLEWSPIARMATKNRVLLHQLGFLSGAYASSDDDEAEQNGAASTNGAAAAAS